MSSLRAAPNLTPMIDVMLVLLLIFMIQQLLIPALALPTSKTAIDKPKPDAVTLRIDRRGVFELSTDSEYGGKGRRVARADLGAELARLYEHRVGDHVLYLMADSSLAFDVIDDALSIAREAGVRVVATVTERRGR
ncbi:MAG TPA: biopolymer transporter ExbD [Gemmatimonadales bacterium]|nr:biopolymer transporter ExbD [Gemmatimonadales bacterium]